MATDTRALTYSNSSDATFRAWASGVSAALQACGLVKTTDTGQIDFATVLTSTAADQVRGYEIFRFSDSLQATRPVFIKVEYGSGASVASSPGMWVSVGTGTDGAGNLTGNTSRQKVASLTAAAGALTTFVSGSSNRIGFAVYTSHFGTFMIERSKDDFGVDTGDFIVFAWKSAAGTASKGSVVVPHPSVSLAVVSIAQLMAPAPGVSGLAGNALGIYPVFPWWYRSLNPMLTNMTYWAIDLVAGTPLQVTVYGQARTYMPLGTNGAPYWDCMANANNVAMMLWE